MIIQFLYILISINVIFSKNLIKYEEIDSISIIKFNNINKNNQFDTELLIELNNILNSINTNTTNVLIITGEGDNFLAIGEIFNKQNESSEYKSLMSKIFEKIENYPIPIIAVVNGLAIGEKF